MGLSDDGSSSAFQGTLLSPSFFCASVHQVVNGVILALCMHITSQAPQHFRSSKTQTYCGGCSLSQEVTAVPAYTKRVWITNPLKLEKGGGGGFKRTIKEHTHLTSNKQGDSTETNRKSKSSRKLSHHTSPTSPTGQAAFDIPPDI